MPIASIEVREVGAATPLIKATRKSENGKYLQEMTIGPNGVRWGSSKNLPWALMIRIWRAIEKGKVSRYPRKTPRVRGLSLVFGSALKSGGQRICYVAVWSGMKKGAQHPTGAIMTIGITDDRIRLGKRNQDVDTATPLKWDELGNTIREKLGQIRNADRLRNKNY
jgi:hypothetical protein